MCGIVFKLLTKISSKMAEREGFGTGPHITDARNAT